MIGALLAGLSGALLAGGLVLGWWALTPQPVRPPSQRKPGRLVGWWQSVPSRRRLAAVVALAVGLAIGLATGWAVAIVVLPAAVLGLPSILVISDENRLIARLDAIAEWTRNLAGVLSAGQGIEAALQASLRSTPEAIRPEVSRLVARLRTRWPTEAALRAFADDLDDATGDLVSAALILGASKRGDGLARVLTGLSESVAEDVRARRQVEADRAKPRTAARTVTLISIAALATLSLTGQLLAPDGTPGGQLVLAALLAGYAGALAWLKRMSVTPRAPRFLGSGARKVVSL